MDGPDLSHLLDGTDAEKPTSDVLNSIVSRHRRLRARRARTAATLGIVILLAGAGVGIGLSRRAATTSAMAPRLGSAGGVASTAPRSAVAIPAPSTTTNAPEHSGSKLGTAPTGLGWVAAGYGAGSFFGASLPSSTSAYGLYGSLGNAVLAHLFTRSDDGVTVRAFTATWGAAPLEVYPIASGSSTPLAPSPTPVITASTTTTTTTVGTGPGSSVTTPPTLVPPESCGVKHGLVVEVSDAGAVGVVTVPLGPSLARPIDVLSDEMVGIAEHSPIGVVVAHTSGPTAAVRAEFAGGGLDEMTVVDGWAVLVQELPASSGGGTGRQGTATMAGQAEVYALSTNGTVVEQADLPGSGALAMPVAACLAPNGGVSQAVGSGSTGSSSPAASPPSAKRNGG
jgi:hypothetical protein